MVSNRLLSGMTLITVMFALAIAGSVLTSIFITQTSLIDRIADIGMSIQRIMIAEQFLYENEFRLMQDQEPVAQKEHRTPELRLSFARKKPAENSSLARFKGIELHEVAVKWTRNGIAKEDRIVVLMHKHEEPAT